MRILEVKLDEKDWIMGCGIGIRKGNKQLYDLVNEIVMQMRESGQALKMEGKWLSKK